MKRSASEEVPASTHVIRLVAELEGVDPLSLDPPLNEVVDPDALDMLFETTLADGFVRFEYCGYTVHVDSQGAVVVDQRADGTPLLAAEHDDD